MQLVHRDAGLVCQRMWAVDSYFGRLNSKHWRPQTTATTQAKSPFESGKMGLVRSSTASLGDSIAAHV